MADISKIKLPNNSEYLLKDIKALSRGEQLVTNGSGMIGNNTNFSYWTFDGSKANSSAGSFTRTGGYANIGTDDFFPVNANEKYKFEFDMVSQNNAGTMYGMLLLYDVDKIAITASDTMFYSGTLTTLARELKNGDTKVYLTDASNYKTYGTGSHLRMFTFWDYKNSFGYLYPPETYSRNHIFSAWENDNSIDKVNNVITLTTAYTGVTRPAGTYVSQGCSGGTYKYSAIAGSKVPVEWTHYTGYFNGTDYSGLNKGGMFFPATAYCKVGFLWNYNSASDQFWVTNVSVKEVPKEAKHSDSADTSTNATKVKQTTGVGENYCMPSSGDEVQVFRATTTSAGGDGHVIGFTWAGTTAYGAQVFIDTDPTYNMAIRQRNSSGTWQPWKKIFTANDTIPVENGGTGRTNATDAANQFMNALVTGSSTPVDADYYISQYAGGGTSTTTYHRRPVSALWEYIKGKISSILGLTASNYGGTSAKATADASGNTITTYYAPKSTAVTNVALATNKITKTINGTTTDVVTAATTSTYGITKLSTATNSTAVDVAATPSAVKTAYDLADTANGTANTALSGVNGNLIYDHTFTISNGVATFTPHVYQKGQEVTTNYAASCFKWKYRLIDGSEVNLTTNSNRGCTVTISGMGYGGHVIGIFTPPS